MIIIGVDFHPEFQQIASVDTGEFQEKPLAHPAEAEKFYRSLVGQNVRMGMEASGHARWFERRGVNAYDSNWSRSKWGFFYICPRLFNRALMLLRHGLPK